jgi:hypothetical protein
MVYETILPKANIPSTSRLNMFTSTHEKKNEIRDGELTICEMVVGSEYRVRTFTQESQSSNDALLYNDDIDEDDWYMSLLPITLR